jgi:uridine phosphorylase
MLNDIPPSELVLNSDGSIYHLSIRPEDLADTVILVGDQGRVPKVSRHFDKIEFRRQNREFVTHTGTFGGSRLTVMSTGIGTDNIDIVLNELDALVNIDLNQRKVKDSRTSLRLIRLGTCGSLQEDLPVDSFALSTHGIGFDGLLNFYAAGQDVEDTELTDAFMRHTQWLTTLPRPYIVPASEGLLALLNEGTFSGMTATANGFYGPQGRKLRLAPAMPDLNDRLNSFSHGQHRIINFEMETSALYGLGKALGHECATVCAVIANRYKMEYSKNHDQTVERLIVHLLDRLTCC